MICGRLGRRLRRRLAGKTVKHKLGFITLLAVSCAVLAAAAVLLAFRILEQRTERRAETLALAHLVAENAVGPVSFQDRAAAESVLATLRAQPSIRGAVIDLPAQRNFAVYGTPPPESRRRRAAGGAADYDGWWLHTSAVVGNQTSSLGTVHLAADLRPLVWESLRASAIAFALALALALLLSLFVLARLRDVILRPVENLSAVTRLVTENADFSPRAKVISDDEVGELTRAFNRMLDRLQAKEAQLRAANADLRAEMDERRKLEARLLETSRQAGMAQVATGVLHNVGNVLNSVNISAHLLRDSLAVNPRLRLLKQTADLLRGQPDIARFIADDPRGRLVPRLLLEVIDQMVAAQPEFAREIEQMVQHVDHIKQIVAMQQGYAKAGGVLETLAPSALFEEAILLVQASIDRHGVHLTRAFDAAPDYETDRHQVLQILVNFLTNAVQAVKPNQDGERHITLRLACDEERIAFAVEDNGTGIASENLEKIFQHGFSTRRDGHGFGLHSGALAARNLGGRLSVHSDGPGHGACFTLELPVTVPQLTATVA